MDPQIASKIGKFWSQVSAGPRVARTNWWESEFIRSRVNKLVSGKSGLTGISAGINHVLAERLNGRKLDKAISVGCGTGQKEMQLLKLGIVNHFTLFEYSEERVKQGLAMAKKSGLHNRVTFKIDDAFTQKYDEQYDCVHWNNSLHHMFDADAAVRWSYEILKKDGVFYMDDFIGAQRFQWSDQTTYLASRARSILPKKYLANPHKKSKKLFNFLNRYTPQALVSCSITKPVLEKLIERDPSEAADSHRILDAVKKWFPNAEITLTGGVIYHLALRDIIHNFDETNGYDLAILELLMLVDQLSSQIPGYEPSYATALAFKK